MAVTADGKIDTVARRGARISGPADTRRVDQLRAEADAILVGGHTLLREDPRLSVRDDRLVERRRTEGRTDQPAKIGIASTIPMPGGDGALPLDSRFLQEGGGQVVLFTTSATEPNVIDRLARGGADVIVREGPRIDLTEALGELLGRGIGRLLVEGGSTVVAALFAAGLVDEIQLAIAPRIFGGETAPTPVGGPGFGFDDAIDLWLTDVTTTEDGDVIARYGVSAA